MATITKSDAQSPIGERDCTEASTAHEDRSNLWEEVLSLIRPYRTAGSPLHPFTIEEMVVIAALVTQEAEVTHQQIFACIYTNFVQYAERAIDILWDVQSKPHLTGSSEQLLDELDRAFQNYELPLSEGVPVTDVSTRTGQRQSKTTWKVDERAARGFLTRHLVSPREGYFDLLALPVELRMSIYEYALSNAQLEPYIVCTSTAGRTTKQRCFLVAGQRFRRRTRGLDKLLAVVHVNKQLYREALPIFFRINEFNLALGELLGPFVRMLERNDPETHRSRQPLCSLEPVRIHHITMLHIDYVRWAESTVHSQLGAFSKLRKAKRLRRLTIYVRDEQWFPRKYLSGRARDGQPTEPEDLPGIGELIQLGLHGELVRGGKSAG